MSWSTALSVLQSPFTRVIFPTATASASLAIAPLTGNLLGGALGLIGLLSIIGFATWVAMGQADWMYDQAAAKGFDAVNFRNLQRKGDVMGIYAERARQGKMKSGRVARRVSGWLMRGPSALLWKELILSARVGFWTYVFILPVTLIPTAALYLTVSQKAQTAKMLGPISFGLLAFLVFILTSVSFQQGFVELLRRVDVTKSLPFSAQVSVFWELIGKVIPSAFIILFSSLVAVILHPAMWGDALSAIIVLPAFGMMLVSVALVTTMLFPDFDDPTQRGLRGMLQMLAIVICAAPPAGAMIASYVLSPSPLIGAIPAVLMEAGITFGATLIAGTMYANYSPTE